MKTLRKNDRGISIRLRIKDDDGVLVDISGSSTKTLIFKKPDRSVVSETADYLTDGTDGIVMYSTESGFLDTPGIWEVQAYIVIGTNKYTSTRAKFRVEDVIS